MVVQLWVVLSAMRRATGPRAGRRACASAEADSLARSTGAGGLAAAPGRAARTSETRISPSAPEPLRLPISIPRSCATRLALGEIFTRLAPVRAGKGDRSRLGLEDARFGRSPPGDRTGASS